MCSSSRFLVWDTAPGILRPPRGPRRRVCTMRQLMGRDIVEADSSHTLAPLQSLPSFSSASQCPHPQLFERLLHTHIIPMQQSPYQTPPLFLNTPISQSSFGHLPGVTPFPPGLLSPVIISHPHLHRSYPGFRSPRILLGYAGTSGPHLGMPRPTDLPWVCGRLPDPPGGIVAVIYPPRIPLRPTTRIQCPAQGPVSRATY